MRRGRWNQLPLTDELLELLGCGSSCWRSQFSDYPSAASDAQALSVFDVANDLAQLAPKLTNADFTHVVASRSARLDVAWLPREPSHLSHERGPIPTRAAARR